MMPASRCFILAKNNNTFLKVISSPSALPAAARAITKARSSSVNHFAFSGKSETRKYDAMPMSMVAIPSRIKTQRQALKPRTIFMLAIALARRPPKALATRTEHQ